MPVGEPLDRAALARAVLDRAELAAGVRRPASVAPVVVHLPATAAATATAALAPRPVPTAPGGQNPDRRPAHRDHPAHSADHLLPVHEDLAPLLPSGALRRGTVVAVQGSTGLLLTLVATASHAGAWTVVVGHPTVGMLAAADAGMDLGRIALVPRPGPDAAATVAALVDGVDVVVIGPDAALGAVDRKRLLARARERGAVLVSAGEWPGAHVVLTARAGSWAGTDRGAGWLRRRTVVVVERVGRAGASQALTAQVELPLGHERLPYLADVPAAPSSAQRPALVPAGDEGPDLRLVG